MSDTPAQKLTGTLLGLLFAGAGAGIMGYVWHDPSAARAPLWVVDAACMCFVLAGLWMIAQTFGLTLIATLCGLAAVYMLAAPGIWMLVDGQGAACTVGAALSGAGLEGAAPSWMCRSIFGGGGILVLAAALGLTWAAFVRRRTDGPTRG